MYIKNSLFPSFSSTAFGSLSLRGRIRTANGLAGHVVLFGCLLANCESLTVRSRQPKFVNASMNASVFRHIFIVQNKMTV